MVLSKLNRGFPFWAGAVRAALVVSAIIFGYAGNASAYVGDTFMNVPGATGSWQGAPYKNWIRVEARYWDGKNRGLGSGGGQGDRMTFAGPPGPPPGVEGRLVIAMDKNSPDLPKLMAMCTGKVAIPELSYVEPTVGVRPVLELGPKPASVPEYWEYKLKDVQISDCPVVDEGTQQALVVSFKDIEWLNHDPKSPADIKIHLQPKDLPDVKPAKDTGKSKVFTVEVAIANDVSDDQCPMLNAAPPQEEFYRLMPKDEADKMRVKLGEKGPCYGVCDTGDARLRSNDGNMDFRGPDRLSVTEMPGIVRDPGFYGPVSKVAYGLDLDGNDGSGAAPSSTCKHENYTSVDGKTRGIDNQLFRALGCNVRYRGDRKDNGAGSVGGGGVSGIRNGAYGGATLLVQISGIDNEQNDDNVDVSLIYSRDKVGQDVSGKHLIPYLSYRAGDKPEEAFYAVHLRGRIVNGEIITEPVKKLDINFGDYTPLLTLFEARMRLRILPDGRLDGVVGGYEDWKVIANRHGSSYAEQFFSYTAPGVYNALKRNADGMKDPNTGECNGISTAFWVRGLPAYLTPMLAKVADARAGTSESR